MHIQRETHAAGSNLYIGFGYLPYVFGDPDSQLIQPTLILQQTPIIRITQKHDFSDDETARYGKEIWTLSQLLNQVQRIQCAAVYF